MNNFLPLGYMTIDQAINRVDDRLHGDAGLLLTEEETAKLRDFWARQQRATRSKPQPVVPVTKVGYRRTYPASKITTFKAPDAPATDAQPRHKVTQEEMRDLLNKEAHLKERRATARERVRQALYAGRLPSETIMEGGSLVRTPRDIWGGDQWLEVSRSGRIKFDRGLIDTVSGRPLVRRIDVEAVFNTDQSSKEKSQAERKAATNERNARIQLAAEKIWEKEWKSTGNVPKKERIATLLLDEAKTDTELGSLLQDHKKRLGGFLVQETLVRLFSEPDWVKKKKRSGKR